MRPAVVAALVAGVAAGMPAEQWDALDASDAELVAAAAMLARHAIEADDAPPLLGLSYRNVLLLGAQGRALGWLADQLGPLWASRPDTDLASVLMTLPRDRLAYLRAELALVGLEL